MKFINTLLLLCLLAQGLGALHSIKDCAKLKHGRRTTVQEDFDNAKCWEETIAKAQQAADGQRIAHIPKDLVVQMMPINVTDINDVTLRIDGVVLTSTHWKHWPYTPIKNTVSDGVIKNDSLKEPFFYKNFWNFQDGKNLKVEGSGLIDGQGYMWWIREILQLNKHQRPQLVMISNIHNIEWSGVDMKNSPMYHMVPRVINGYFHDFEIYVDLEGQFQISQLFWDFQAKSPIKQQENEEELLNLGFKLPTFPLNTDGVDFFGKNATFRRIKIQNFDDTIVPKPSHRKSWGTPCTQDILVEDCQVTYGVGMTIGTVSPTDDHACINNVTFRNIEFDRPLKAIYVKTNPGDGTGEIRDITYENIKMYFPVWWAVYIGPQQQKQPGGDGPGCMIYPLNKDCPTQPKVSIDNIVLRNITSYESILPVGIIRCNETNPCKGFVFEDIQFKSTIWDLLGIGFITENVYGTSKNAFPDPNFQKEGEPLQKFDFSEKYPIYDMLLNASSFLFKENLEDVTRTYYPKLF